MTYKEATAAGYKAGDQRYQRGYVSRTCDPDEQEVYEAKGYRKGQLYVLLPCSYSTRFCVRQYLYR